MKILYLCQRVPYPPNKGEKIRTYHQLVYLKAQGCDIHILCPTENTQDLEYAETLRKKLACQVVTSPLRRKPFRLLTGLLKNQSLSTANFWSKALLSELKSWIQSESFDWVICTSSAMSEYLRQLNLQDIKPASPKLGVDFMDLDSDKWRQYADTARGPMRWVYQREAKKIHALEAWCGIHGDACWLIAENEVALYRQHHKCTLQHAAADTISAIGNGIDLSSFKPSTTKQWHFERPTFLFTGVMDYLPNEDAAMQFLEHAWQKILKEYPEARFVVAGMNPTPKLEQRAAQMHNVVLTGFVDDIIAYYQTADVFVAPFTLARGVQNKILQAMACGLPTVTTPIGAEGIAHTPNEDLIVVDTPEQFAETLFLALKTPEHLIQLGQAARERMETQYAWPAQLHPFHTQLKSLT